jgi:hypothetical protein
MPVVPEVEQLVAPLGDDPKRIFNEGHDDKKSANGWEVTVVLCLRVSNVQILMEEGGGKPQGHRHWHHNMRGGGETTVELTA